MKKKSGSPAPEIREKVTPVRFSEEERAAIATRAAEAEWSVSQVVRWCVRKMLLEKKDG